MKALALAALACLGAAACSPTSTGTVAGAGPNFVGASPGVVDVETTASVTPPRRPMTEQQRRAR